MNGRSGLAAAYGANFWQDVVDSLAEAVIVLSAELKPRALNPLAENLLGVSQANPSAVEELLRRNAPLWQMVGSCLAHGQNLYQPEIALALGHHAVAVQAAVSPLMTRTGRRQGVLILLHDLAYQRAAQHGFGAEFNLGISPAGLAHEIKNPLTGIKGAAELLQKMLLSDQRAVQYCEVIRGAADRIASLVEQVLAVGASRPPRREPVNIHRVLHNALAMAGLYPEPPAGIRVEQLFDPSLPELTADSAELERAFLNLVRNAAEAVGTQGTIRLSTRIETEFRVSAKGRRRQYMRVELADSGKGIAASELRHLFTPFYTTKPTGTGLGLVLSQQIVSRHGGRLWAERGGIRHPLPGHRDAPGTKPETDLAESGSGRDSAESNGESQNGLPGMTFKVILPVGAADGEADTAL